MHPQEEGPVKRARQSCDTCRNRKTRCIMQETGKCRYCESVGSLCSTSATPRKRPYYRVSEEEYESCMRLLRHFVPDTDLNLEAIKRILANVESNESPKQVVEATADRDDGSSLVLKDTGCMVIDPIGNYILGYVDADSSLRFYDAARIARQQSRSSQSVSSPSTSTHDDPSLLSPFITGIPRMIPSTDAARDIADLRLPSREICTRYVGLFFEQVHCIYWIYSSEQFYSQLDKTLEYGLASSSPSWICSLYSIFAISSALVAEDPELRDVNPPCYYLSVAKYLSVQSSEMADVECLRATVLLALAFHSHTLSVAFYLTIGVAVRIALSLGLHRNVCPKPEDWVERERCQRLWWTIYQLDQEVSMQLGHPCAIVDDALWIKTSFASEQLLDPGRSTPLEFQKVFITLIKLKKKISQTLHIIPSQTTRKVPLQQVTNVIHDLQNWFREIPPHLQYNGSQIYPSHRRAVYILHLRYWTAMMHVTRPFLLYRVMMATGTTVPAQQSPKPRDYEIRKRQQYEELGDKCQNAAEQAIEVLRMMLEHKSFSSLIVADASCIQEVLQVFLLVKYKDAGVTTTSSTSGYLEEQFQFCLRAYQSLAQVGWPKMFAPEIMALIKEATGSGSGSDDHQEMEKAGGVQFFLQNTAAALPPVPLEDDRGLDPELNFDASQVNIFDTLGLDMEIFSSIDWLDV